LRLALWVGVRRTHGLLVAGSLFGVYEHIEHNLAFELEIRPGAGLGDVWFEALKGASPLLAPGILVLAAILAIAATYYHPALERRHIGDSVTDLKHTKSPSSVKRET
jgi:hypothetical protein